jgi:hypothetical protein
MSSTAVALTIEPIPQLGDDTRASARSVNLGNTSYLANIPALACNNLKVRFFFYATE